MKHFRHAIVTSLIAGALVAPHAPALASAPAAPEAVTITVITTDDPNPTSLTETCGYTQGALFVPASPRSLRRALREASARPRADLPIAVTFNITTAAPGYDSSLGVWTLTLSASALELKTPSMANLAGQVTLDGATQPGGSSVST